MELRLIGIDPGITRTGVALGKIVNGELRVLRHSTYGAEGETWLDRCNDIADKTKTWILNNTNPNTYIRVYIEEPINYKQSRAWSAAIQNRLFASIIKELSEISMEKRPTHICSVRPTTMKKIFTGSGNAKKEVVTAEAKKYYKFKKCWTKLNTETIADAIGILYCCYIFRRDGYGIPGIVEL